MKRQLLLQMVKATQQRCDSFRRSVDAVLTTAKVAVVEGATIETKVSSLGTEIARLGAIPGAKNH
jgi:hypothetical protein